jgi:outer membrane protein OmpA-like peptidoglycan-associated protein
MSAAVTVTLWDATGRTLLAVLDHARAVAWQEELSKPGTATFEVPLDDPKTALIDDRCIVKFALGGEIRFGCVISTETCTLNSDGGRAWIRYDSQSGVGSILGRAVVFPERGLTRKSSDDRLFGFMSNVRPDYDTTWYVPADWLGPAAVSWNDNSFHAGYPPVFKTIDPYANWLSLYPSPGTVRRVGTVTYFRDTFTVRSEIPVVIYASADAYFTLYLDDEVVIEPDYTTTQQWAEARTFKTTLAAGSHVLAARVENSATQRGPVAFLCTVAYLSDTGQPGEAMDTETITGDVNFAFDSYDLTAAGRAAVDDMCTRMTGDAPKVKCVGNTDSVGSSDYNYALGLNRAQAVRDRILSNKPGAVVSVSSNGETDPVASNDTAAGRARNRRVDVTYTHATDPVTTPGDTQTITVVRRSDSRWLVHAVKPTPGWFRASVLRRLFLEARDRGVAGFDGVDIDFDDLTDSSGRAWETRAEYSFPIATLSVLEIAQQLAEAQMDWALDANSMTLRAWVRRGEDRSVGDGAVMLWLGGSITNYETTREAARITDVIAHLSDGSWSETIDAQGTAVVGRVEVGVSLGSALSPVTAAQVSRTLLEDSASPAITVTGQTTALSGPQPYADYGVGDTISVPGHRGIGRMRARVISISVDASGDVLSAYPELVIDRSASVGIAGPGGGVFAIYGDDDGVLQSAIATPGTQPQTIVFFDGVQSWVLDVGAAEEIQLDEHAAVAAPYTAARPLILPTTDPEQLLAVWVVAGQLVTEVRPA